MPLEGSHNPHEKPLPSLSVAPIISNCSGQYLSRNEIGTPIIPLHLVADKQPLENLLAADCWSKQVILAVLAMVGEANKFKLFGAIFVEETNGDTHNAATPFS